MPILLKRAYEKPSPEDGKRILVERLWPRGLKKENAKVDEWLRDVAPSAELRKWYCHDPAKWVEFKKRYWAELDKQKDAVLKLSEDWRSQKSHFSFRIQGRKTQQCSGFKRICRNESLALWSILLNMGIKA